MKRKTGPSIAAAVVIFGFLSGTKPARGQSQPATPVITFVGDSASYSGYIAVGELVTLFGTNLSDGGTYQAQAVPLPTSLGTTQVISSGAPLQLLYVGPSQINLLMSASGSLQNCVGGQCVDLTFNVGNASSVPWFNGYALYAPALFLSGFDCPYPGWPNAGATNVACGLSPIQKPGQFPRPIVTDANYSLVTDQNPARIGQPHVLWLTGLGNPGYTGDLRSQFPSLRIELSRCCLPASLANPEGNATVLYAGAASCFPGLYQMNFTLPNVSTGPDACGVALQIEVWLSVVASATASNFESIPVYVSAAENACPTTGMATVTNITSSVNPSVVGQSVTLTATVNPAAATGTVTFSDGAAIGIGTLTAGMATFSTSAMAGGTHSITARYGGNGQYAGSASSVLTQTVSVIKVNTTTTLTGTPVPGGVAFTSLISPAGATGTVVFLDYGGEIGSAPLNQPVLGGAELSGQTAAGIAFDYGTVWRQQHL
jgi:uncharacterized protein (TIGR03437 family)